MVSGLVADGYADYYEVTAALERRVTAGLTLIASYTFSKTEDNTPGLLSGDPADQLNPFPEDWTALIGPRVGPILMYPTDWR